MHWTNSQRGDHANSQTPRRHETDRTPQIYDLPLHQEETVPEAVQARASICWMDQIRNRRMVAGTHPATSFVISYFPQMVEAEDEPGFPA